MLISEASGVTADGEIIDPIDIEKRSDFSDFMDQRKTNDSLDLVVYHDNKELIFEGVVLTDQYNYSEREEDRGKGFLGIGGPGAGEFVESLAHPVTSAGWNTAQRRYNLAQYFFFLPMDLQSKILPFHSPLIGAYEVTGPLAVMPTALFWILANVFYYLFWLNMLLGIFNTLPAIPLDGGYVFKDGMDKALEKFKPKMNEKRREEVINKLSLSFALFILLLLIMLIIGPYMLAI
jgi:hypothetical protein